MRLKKVPGALPNEILWTMWRAASELGTKSKYVIVLRSLAKVLNILGNSVVNEMLSQNEIQDSIKVKSCRERVRGVRARYSYPLNITISLTHGHCTLKNYEHPSYYSILSSNVTVIIESYEILNSRFALEHRYRNSCCYFMVIPKAVILLL